MKTIAIDIRLLGQKRTGDEMVFRFLTQSVLALDKVNRYVLLTNERNQGKLTALYHELHIVGQENVEIVTLLGQNRFVWNFFSVPIFLLRKHIDVFHTQYILPLFIPRRTKVLVHIHDVSFRALPWLIGWKDRLFLALFIPHALRRADCIIVPSQFTCNEVVHYFGVQSEKVVVVPNALGDGFEDEAAPAEVARVCAHYHLPSRYIVVVGTLQPRKNIPFLIQSVSKLRERDPNIALVLVGNRLAHHFDKNIDRAIAETNLSSGVIFPGFVEASDLPAVIRGALVYVFPSRYEGFGIPLLEAMSQGVPIAASDIPSLREVAKDAALYFDSDPSHGRVDACVEILYTLSIDSELRKRLVQAGKTRLGQYSWEQSAQLLVHMYDEQSFPQGPLK